VERPSPLRGRGVPDIHGLRFAVGAAEPVELHRIEAGAAGLQVVPDLAVAMPTITDGGRTYTFQLRKRLRYSNGQEVRASDFRSSVERALSPAALGIASQGYYQDVVFSTIVGYGACRSHPQTCDLTKGIQTDDRTGTITIHLSNPDPALPQKLATTFADLVPPGAPPADSGKPVPGTGPYMVSKLYQRGHAGVLLTRNPHFQEWSSDAQPAGYPDTIRYTQYTDPGAALTLSPIGDPSPSELESQRTWRITVVDSAGAAPHDCLVPVPYTPLKLPTIYAV